METKLAINAVSPAVTAALPPASPAPALSAARLQDDVADLRLVIEEDRASGLFIYKTIDRQTGDLVQILPREAVVRLHDATAYGANPSTSGAVGDTKA